MLPKGTLVGNIATDPQSGVAQATSNTYCRFSVACNDSFAKPNTPPRAHFFNCVVWGKKAQFVQTFLKKGDKVLIAFSLSTNSYTNQEGKTVKTFDLFVEDIESVVRSSSNQQVTEEKAEVPTTSGEELGITLDEIYS